MRKNSPVPNQIIAVELIVFRNFKNPRLPTTKALAFASSNLSPYVVWALGGQPPYPPAAKPLGGPNRALLSATVDY